MSLSRIVLATALLLVSVATSAAVYRWVDSDGHVHYTDRAVPNSELVNVRTGHVSERAPEASSSGTPTTGDQLAQKKGECERKKAQYESYKGATKIVETDSLGRKHEFTADEQKQIVEKAQQEMQDVCGAAGVSTSSATP